MSMHRSKVDKNIICTYGALMLGIFIGCILFGILIICDGNQWLDLGLEEYDVVATMNLSQEKILFYLLRKRILQIILYILIMILTSYSFASILYCGGFGCYYGFLLCNLVVKYNLYGFGYVFACFFPHYLFYFILIYVCGKKNNERNGYHNDRCKNVNIIQYLFKIFVIFMLFTFAIIWETNFQKNFLNYFFQYLV